jgi:hypothetical protein
MIGQILPKYYYLKTIQPSEFHLNLIMLNKETIQLLMRKVVLVIPQIYQEILNHITVVVGGGSVVVVAVVAAVVVVVNGRSDVGTNISVPLHLSAYRRQNINISLFNNY